MVRSLKAQTFAIRLVSDGLKNLESEEENLDEEDRVEFDKEVDELEKALGLEEDE